MCHNRNILHVKVNEQYHNGQEFKTCVDAMGRNSFDLWHTIEMVHKPCYAILAQNRPPHYLKSVKLNSELHDIWGHLRRPPPPPPPHEVFKQTLTKVRAIYRNDLYHKNMYSFCTALVPAWPKWRLR